MTRRRPALTAQLDRGLISVLLSIVTLAVMAVALVTESLLVWAVAGLSAAVMVGQARRATQRAAAKSAPRRARTAAAPKPGTAVAPAGGVVRCTETGKPIADCGCATRHVATPEGAQRYGLPVGTPYGRRRAARERAS